MPELYQDLGELLVEGRPFTNRQVMKRRKVSGIGMTQKIWPPVILILLLGLISACVPAEVEPGVADLSQTPPVNATQPAVTSVPSAITPDMLPLPPEAVPDALPVYRMVLDPIAATGNAVLAWARSFGWSDAQVAEETDEMVRLLS